MKFKNTLNKHALKLAATFASTNFASAVFAHDGHGQANAHWHATDAWGFVALGVMLVVAVWLSRGGK